MPRPRLSIVVPCRNDVRLERALRTARHTEVETIVVLNDATTAVRTIAVKEADHVVEVAERNLALARQAGIDAAAAESVMFLDSDCWVAPSTVNEVLRALEGAEVVRPRLHYMSRNTGERLVARVRQHTTVDTDLPLMPLAMRKEVESRIGGYFFDLRLAWGEDWDLAARITKAGISVIRVGNPGIFHDPLSIWADLDSARRIGLGRYLQCRAELFPGRSLNRDLRFVGEGRTFRRLRVSHGIAAAVYHMFGWRLAYKWGYHTSRLSAASIS
jgi:glycosyltransferase involved in cell wall biosynthesis